MNSKGLLDQLLRSGADFLQDSSKSQKASSPFSQGMSTLLDSKGSAALAGGALGLLLGSKSGRKVGGKVLTYGGLAVLGTLAYKAFQNYHQRDANPVSPSVKPLEQIPAKEVEAHCTAILVAIIAASKADGHIDDREMDLIKKEVAKLTTEQDLQLWFERELKKPLDPTEVAKYATSALIATEMYLASLLTIDEQNFMEKTYLAELARQMQLPPPLQSDLAQQVKSVTVG